MPQAKWKGSIDGIDLQGANGLVSSSLVRGSDGRIVEPTLAQIASYRLTGYAKSSGNGRVALAFVRLPNGKLGGFAVYRLSHTTFAEWFPSSWIGKVTKRDARALRDALPFVAALAEKYDPESYTVSSVCLPKWLKQ